MTSGAASWPPVAGEMAERIRSFDWTATPIGPPASWPPAIRTMVEFMLASPQLASVAVGPERVFLYNDAAAKHYGGHHPGALGCPLADVFAHEFGRVANFYDRVFAGESLHVPAQPLDPAQSGTEEVFDAYLVPVRDADGAVIAAHMTGFAMGEQRRSEVRLRDSEARMRAVLQQAPLAMAFTGPSGKILFRNAMFDQLWGRPAHDTTAETYSDVYNGYHLDGRPIASEYWPGARAVHHGELIQDEVLEIVHSSGRRVPCWFAAGPIRDEDGRIAGGVVLFRDVSEERRIQEALRESEAGLAAELAGTELLRGLAERLVPEESSRTFYEELLSAAMTITRSDAGTVQLYEPETRSLVLLVTHGFERRITEHFRRVDAGSQTACGIALRTNKRTFVDFDDDTDEACRMHVEAGYRSAQATPLLSRDGIPLGMLNTHWRAAGHRPSKRELRFLDLLARQAADLIEQRQAQSALQESERKYRTLFTNMGQAYIEVELIRDENDRAVDYRYLQLNPAYERLTGIPAEKALGRASLDVVPGLSSFWAETFEAAVRLRAPQKFDYDEKALGRWYQIFTYPGVGDRLTVLAEDITEQKRADMALRESEERQAFLLVLSDALRPIDDPIAIKEAASRLLGEHLHVDRVAYAEFLDEGRIAATEGGYCAPGVAPVDGRYNTDDFADFVADLRRGAIAVVRDAQAEPAGSSTTFENLMTILGIRAAVAVPLIKTLRLSAALYLHSIAPRDWTDAELVLVAEVGDRTWGAVERARAEAALRESEERQAFLLKLSDALRPLTESGDIERAATRLLGEHLKADRCFLSPVYEDGSGMCVREEYLRAGASSVLGDYTFAQFGDFVGVELHAGRILAVEDVSVLTGLGPAERASYETVGIGAYLLIPLVRDGRLAAFLTINHRTPRPWCDADKAVARQTADRLWTARERGRVEEALLESEQRLREFGEASQDVLWIRDAETLQWTYLTPAFEAIYGLSRDEALSGDNYRSWTELIVPEDRDLAMAAIERVREGEHVTFDYRVRRPSDGTVRWLRNTDFPITDATGKAALVGGVGHDLTVLREAELRLQTLMEGIPQLVWRAVDGGQWTWASPQWTGYTGQAEQDSHDLGWLDPVHPDDRAGIMDVWSEATDRGAFEAECRIRRSDDGRYRWFQTRATPVRDEAGRIMEWLGTSTDINDLRDLQERQKVLVAELQHRTRNLMGVVRSTSEKTARSSADLADFRGRFRDRLDALSRAQGLLSRLNRHDRVTFDELIQMELAAMDCSAHRVTLDGPKGVRLRSSTVQTLAMALHELATNAVKYGALGQFNGRLAITWRLEPSGEGGKPWLHIAWRESEVEMPSPATAPRGTGHGRELIERALPYQLSAKTAYTLGSDGVHCTISIPVSASTVELEHA